MVYNQTTLVGNSPQSQEWAPKFIKEMKNAQISYCLISVHPTITGIEIIARKELENYPELIAQLKDLIRLYASYSTVCKEGYSRPIRTREGFKRAGHLPLNPIVWV